MADQTNPPTNPDPMKSDQPLFGAAALLMLALSILLFAGLRIFGGVFQQARDGAIEALLIQSAAIGVIVMASIQAVRAIIPVRSKFHRVRVSAWLGRSKDKLKVPADFKERMQKHIESDAWLKAYIKPDTTEEDILHTLLQLTTAEGGDRPEVSQAFFDLPLEQLCGQISAGAERAIVDPMANGPILLRLANAAGEEDVLNFFKAHHELELKNPGDGSEPSNSSPSSNMPSVGEERKDERSEAFMRARASVEERVRRSIDCLQIESGFDWRRRLRALAVTLAAALGLTTALIGKQFLASVPAAIASGVVGGFFAMLARDLAAIVERLRRVP